MAPDLLPPGSRCKFCPATIHWVPTRLGRKVALDPEPAPDGAWVLHQDPALGPTAYHYSPSAHGGATRYRSHLERCHPNDGKGPTPPKRRPDPTAGLKFPRRPLPGPPPDRERRGLDLPPLAAVLVAISGALYLLAIPAPPPPRRPRACGSERWAQKILTDGAQLRQVAPPPVRTVTQLAALEAPTYREGRPREGAELEVVAVVGYLRAVKLEEDGDLHMLLSDTADEGAPTLVLEVPDPNCAARSPYAGRMAAARAATAKLIGAVFGKNFRTLSTPKRVRVVGAVFFDKLHGQKGMAANGVELHPLLDLEEEVRP